MLLARTLCLQCTACSSRCRHSFLPKTSLISTQQKEEKHLTNASQHGIWRCQGQSLYVLHRVRILLETSVLWADRVWPCSGPCISMCSVSRNSVSPGRGYRATRAIEFAVRLRRLLAGSYVFLGLSFSNSLSDFHISDTARYVHIAEKQTASSPRSRPSTRLPSLRGCVVGGRLANSEIRPNRAIEWNNLCGGQKAIAVRRISCRLWRGISQILESSVCCQGAWVALRIVRDHTVIYARAYSFCSNDCQHSI